jgi:hypothetical protein
MAFTMALAILVSPYGFNYDTVGFEIAMATMLLRSTGVERALFALIWLGSGFAWIAAGLYGIFGYPLFAAFAAALCWPFRRDARLPAGASALRTPHGHDL